MAKADCGASTSRPQSKASVGTIWRERFLEELCQTSNVAAAARCAEIDVSTAYRARRNEPEFAQKWYAALCEGYTHLEMDVLRRLREGDFLAADGHKYDFANALRILSAHRETIGRKRDSDEYEHEDAILASINAKLDAIRQRVKSMPDIVNRPQRSARHSDG